MLKYRRSEAHADKSKRRALTSCHYNSEGKLSTSQESRKAVDLTQKESDIRRESTT